MEKMNNGVALTGAKRVFACLASYPRVARSPDGESEPSVCTRRTSQVCFANCIEELWLVYCLLMHCNESLNHSDLWSSLLRLLMFDCASWSHIWLYFQEANRSHPRIVKTGSGTCFGVLEGGTVLAFWCVGFWRWKSPAGLVCVSDYSSMCQIAFRFLPNACCYFRGQSSIAHTAIWQVVGPPLKNISFSKCLSIRPPLTFTSPVVDFQFELLSPVYVAFLEAGWTTQSNKLSKRARSGISSHLIHKNEMRSCTQPMAVCQEGSYSPDSYLSLAWRLQSGRRGGRPGPKGVNCHFLTPCAVTLKVGFSWFASG